MYIYKVMTTPDYTKRASMKYIKKRLAEDPEFRKRTNEWNRKSYEKNKEITVMKRRCKYYYEKERMEFYKEKYPEDIIKLKEVNYKFLE